MQDQCPRLVLEQVGTEATEPLAPRPLEANSRRVRDSRDWATAKVPTAAAMISTRTAPLVEYQPAVMVATDATTQAPSATLTAGADETNPARTAGTEICSAVRALGGSDVDPRVGAPEHELAAEALGGGWSLSQLVAAVDGIPGVVTSDSMAVPFRRGNEWLISCAAFGRPRKR